MTQTLVDTGPLVALFDGSDAHHEWAKQRFDELHPPLHTCEPVITEAVFLPMMYPTPRSAGDDSMAIIAFLYWSRSTTALGTSVQSLVAFISSS